MKNKVNDQICQFWNLFSKTYAGTNPENQLKTRVLSHERCADVILQSQQVALRAFAGVIETVFLVDIRRSILETSQKMFRKEDSSGLTHHLEYNCHVKQPTVEKILSCHTWSLRYMVKTQIPREWIEWCGDTLTRTDAWAASCTVAYRVAPVTYYSTDKQWTYITVGQRCFTNLGLACYSS